MRCGTKTMQLKSYEIVAHLVDVCKWFVILDQHLGKLCSLLRIDAHDASQQEDVIRNVAHLLGIQNNLLDLTSFRKTLDHLKMSKLTMITWNTRASLRTINSLESHTSSLDEQYLQNIHSSHVNKASSMKEQSHP